MENHPVLINHIKLYAFKDPDQLIALAAKEKKILIAINAEKILHATDATRKVINDNIGYPDGVGAIWALRQKGKSSVRIPGVELWLKIIEKFHDTKSVYLIGGKREVIVSTVKKLKKEFPKINIISYRDGYLKTDDEEKKLIEDIKLKKPDIVFVAMGSPRQELLMKEMQKVHPAIYQGLGGSFDVYIGAIKRAPSIWSNNGLEWFYRWINEPRTRTKRVVKLLNFYTKLKTNKF